MSEQVNTVELYYEERGQGLPVVLLHGFPFSHAIWQTQQAALSDAARIITPDLRGHGKSPAPEGDYTMDLLASDVLALLDRLNVSRAVWVGHSMGGYILMAALRQAPDRIAGVGLVATHPLADAEEKRFQRRESADLAMENGSGDTAFSMMSQIFAPDVDGTSPLAQSMYDIMVNTAPAGIAGAQRGMALRPDSSNTLRELSVPAVIVAGVDDKIIGLDKARAMAALIPGVQLVEVENAGHMPMVEQPDATTGALRGLIRMVQANER
jgi:pimeloyl-ACP methyl ester carboxylesterase